MSKEISDVLGRLNGDMIALQGMEAKISPPPPGPPVTTEQEAAGLPLPPAKPKKEDYEYVKKLVEEIKGLCTDLQNLVDKETKMPPPPPAEGNPSSQPEVTPATGEKTKK